MNKYAVSVCVVLVVGFLWAAGVGLLTGSTAVRIHDPKYRQTLSTYERDWLWTCTQHRDLFDCDNDLAVLKARK